MFEGTGSTPTQRVKRPAVDLAAGAIVGDYQIESTLGRGGMGVVYSAIQPVIGKRVALKVIHFELCEDNAAVTRFVQEARAVNRIRHPNIVDVFGFGTTPDGRAFLAMELLDGVSLKQRIEHGPPLSREEICDILIEITHALEAAHQAGIVHRDLKPDNVFLIAQTRGGVRLKLLDFGIAKLTALGGFGEPVDCTQPGTLIGTPRYMAPEQARGLAIDGGADVYSLGVVAFELFTGRPPFSSGDSVELLAKHITLRPPVPSSLDGTLPKLADDLVGAMLEKQPALRPSLPAIRESLLRLRSTKPARGSRAQSVTQLDVTPHRRRRWLLVPAAAAVIAIGVAMMFAARSDDRPATAQLPRVPAAALTPSAAVPPPPTPMPETPSASPTSAPVRPPPATPDATARRHKKQAVVKSPAKLQPAKPSVEPATRPAEAKAVPAGDDALRSPFDRNR